MYYFLDYFLLVLHALIVAFNLTGWIWPATRKAHLFLISGTLFSWLGLGLFYGLGYCPLTDWHWQVKYELGERGLPASYIKYYVDQITGLSSNAMIVDLIVAASAILAFILSLWFNWRDYRVKEHSG